MGLAVEVVEGAVAEGGLDLAGGGLDGAVVGEVGLDGDGLVLGGVADLSVRVELGPGRFDF